METIKNSIIYLAAAAMGTVGLTSCSDFLDEQSQDLARVESWQDLDEVLLGDGYMHSAYVKLQNSYVSLGDGTSLDILHIMTDEMSMTQEDYIDYLGYQTSMFGFYTWQQDTGMNRDLKYVGGDDKYWTDLYKRINVCNMVLAVVDEQPEHQLSDVEQKERVKGEAYFLRGMYYYYLVNLYAQPYNAATASSTPGIPVKLTEYVEDKEYLRTPLDEVYKQIISDFSDAAHYLEGKTAKSKYHANMSAANLMLSRVYLYIQDWDKAIDYAEKVLSVNNRLLDINSVREGSNSVSITSPETIFTMGNYLIAVGFCDRKNYEAAFELTDEILALYSKDDKRVGKYFGRSQYGHSRKAFLKYNLQYDNWGGMNDVSSVCLLRTPEAYLNLAEAQACKGLDNDARSTLALYLPTRMTDNPADVLSGDELIDFIRDERAREFLLEGHRWFDLRRYTVSDVRPWSKTIDHDFVYFSGQYSNPISYIDTYRLEKNDAAYTLPIPKSVRDQQVSIGNNPRPDRKANRVLVEDDDDDWEDDDW